MNTLSFMVEAIGSRASMLFASGAWEAMIDVNVKGVLHGIAAARPVFKQQGSGHVVDVVSTAGRKIVPTLGAYAATKNAIRTITEAFRRKLGPSLRVTELSLGMVAAASSASVTDADMQAAMRQRLAEVAIPP